MAKVGESRSVLSTFQWLGVIVTVAGGMIGLDARIRGAVSEWGSRNEADHVRIYGDIVEMRRNLPSESLERRVVVNAKEIARINADLASLREVMEELRTMVGEVTVKLGAE